MSTEENRKKNALAFLNKYEELCKQFGLVVYGCGCCSSPFVTVIDDLYTLEENIDHLKEMIKDQDWSM